MSEGRSALARWLASTSNRTFVVFPLALVAFELALGRATLVPSFAGVPLMVWGYVQYRLVGRYRLGLGGGGPGLATPPERLVTSGPYRYTRNPMYLGHLIFLAGLAITLRSWLGAALFAFHAAWFHRRVLGDEHQLKRRFGAEYADYAARVKRWIPGVV